ncbi:hypothetical protein [Mesorhizobium sp. RIZ17]|uniref:hypothetical protein n=1 Tax=Mesorhizobium sp. RIZ17 TaxID=3132743 RepID=UPI003DA8B191
MSKFTEALERGKQADGRQSAPAKEQVAPVDFGAQARAWLNDVAVAALEAAKAEVAEDVTVDVDTEPLRQDEALAPTVRFQIYRNAEVQAPAGRTFTISVAVSGEVSVSAPGVVAESVGNIADMSDERFRSFIAKQIEAAAKGS